MVLSLKLRKIGDSVGIVLPEQALAHLKLAEGDTIALTEIPEGFQLSASNPEFAKTMAVFEDLTLRYRQALRKLAQ